MSDYRDNFDINPNVNSYDQWERRSLVGPLIALGVILVMIAGVFFFSGSTGEVSGTATSIVRNPAAS